MQLWFFGLTQNAICSLANEYGRDVQPATHCLLKFFTYIFIAVSQVSQNCVPQAYFFDKIEKPESDVLLMKTVF